MTQLHYIKTNIAAKCEIFIKYSKKAFVEKHRSLGPEPHHATLMCDTEKSVGERVEGSFYQPIEKKAVVNKIKETTNVFFYFLLYLKEYFFI